MVAQDIDVGDRLTAVEKHDRDVDQDPAVVVERGERAPHHRLRQLGSEAGPIGQKAEPDTARVSHHADTIGGYGQASRSRSTLHLRSAFRFENLETRNPKFPLLGRHFRVSTRRGLVNDPG